MTLDIDKLLDEATPAETTVYVCFDGKLRGEWDRLEHELMSASTVAESLGEVSPAKRIAQRMESLREQIAAKEVPFTLQAVDPLEWEKFKDTRPTRDDGVDDDGWQEIWQNWIAGMVALACVEPELTHEQAARTRTKITAAQWRSLSNAAWQLNEDRDRVPFSAAVSELISDDGEK